MGGGLMQLVAYGAQDIYLTGQPQITFFKSVYRRHTNFAVESIQQTINGALNFGSRVSVTVSRNGDLLKKLWVEYSPLNLLSGVNTNQIGANVGHALLDQLELEIGGQLIDRQYGKWLTIWNYLTESNPTGQQGGVSTATALGPGEDDTVILPSTTRPTRYNRMAYTHRASFTNAVTGTGAPYRAWVPMQFWFCRNPGLAIPLIALQYHEVKFNITFGQYNGIAAGTAGTNPFNGCSVYADYVYLDTTERRQFAQNAHEYLIDQLQVQSSDTKPSVMLTFNHPVKELIWAPPPVTPVATITPGGSATPGTGFTLSTNATPNSYKIVLNGTDRFTERDITYFTRNQVWDCHTGFGSVIIPDCIAVYSFALRPEEHQPSGTCNFSRIDTAQLVRTVGQAVDIYAINYNVLRIMSGMGGLAYSN
jgi:hypothetical protein